MGRKQLIELKGEGGRILHSVNKVMEVERQKHISQTQDGKTHTWESSRELARVPPYPEPGPSFPSAWLWLPMGSNALFRSPGSTPIFLPPLLQEAWSRRGHDGIPESQGQTPLPPPPEAP